MHSREEIVAALDLLVERGRANDFQLLAFQVAKGLFPGLVMPEWQHDGGEDGFTLLVGEAGKRVSLACSLTATLTKVRNDCRRIRERGVNPDIVVFVTAKPVQRLKVDNWKKEISDELGHDLEVISREGLVTELQRPANAWIGTRYLELGEVKTPLIERVRTLAGDRIRRWQKSVGYDGPRSIDGNCEITSPDSERRSLGVAELAAAIRVGRQLVVTGPGGAGKTTLLARLLDEILNLTDGPVPVAISLAEWSAGEATIAKYVSAELDISEEELVELDASGSVAILLNGWNEIWDSKRSTADLQLRTLLRRVNNAAVLITTREVVDAPVLPRGETLSLRPLTRGERRRLARLSLTENADSVADALDRDHVVDALTRLPLFARAAISVAAERGGVPKSADELLGAIINLEERHEHVSVLADVCRGYHRHYLEDLAAAIAEQGGASLSLERARSVVAETSSVLQGRALIGAVPDALEVLAALRRHHVLQPGTEGSDVVRFRHELLQSWFASHWLVRQSSVQGGGSSSEFLWRVVNAVAWGDALLLLCERARNASGSGPVRSIVVDLIDRMATVDLVAASSLARVAGTAVWSNIGPRIEMLLRMIWSRSSDEEREYAFAGMLATGAPGLADVVRPELTHPDPQVQLRALRLFPQLSLRSLGVDWGEELRLTAPAPRSLLVGEMIRHGVPAELPELVEFIRGVLDVGARASAIEALAFVGEGRLAASFLGPESDVWDLPSAGRLVAWLPMEELEALRPTIAEVVARVPSVPSRIDLVRILFDLGGREFGPELEAYTSVFPGERRGGATLEALATLNPKWARAVAIDRIRGGDDLTDQWTFFRQFIDESDIQGICHEVVSAKLNQVEVHRRLAPLWAIAPTAIAGIVFQRIREVRESGVGADDEAGSRPDEGLLYELREQPLTVRAAAVLGPGNAPKALAEIDLVLGLVGPSGPMAAAEELDETTRKGLRALTLGIGERYDADGSLPRHQRARLATLLAECGQAGDETVIVEWDRRDRCQAVVERQGSGRGRFSTTNYYCGALRRLRSEGAIDHLVRLLDDPEYFGDASAALASIEVPELGGLDKSLRRASDFDLAFSRRETRDAGRMPDGTVQSTRTASFAPFIMTALSKHLDLRANGATEPFPHGLGEGARALGRMRHAAALPVLFRCGAVDGCEWGVVDGLVTMLQEGFRLPAEETTEFVGRLIRRIGIDQVSSSADPWWFGVRCLTVQLLSDDPDSGVTMIRGLNLQRVGTNIRDIVGILGQCRAESAVSLLVEILGRTSRKAWFAPNIVEAISVSRSALGWQCVLAEVEVACDEGGTSLGTNDYYDALSRGAARMIGGDPGRFATIAQQAHEVDTPHGRDLLGRILLRHGGDGAALGACDLLRDRAPNPIPYGVSKLLEEASTTNLPYGDRGAYTIVPRTFNALRERLLSLVLDDTNRTESARQVLLRIELGRVEIGRAMDEPRHPNLKAIAWDSDQIPDPWPLL